MVVVIETDQEVDLFLKF